MPSHGQCSTATSSTVTSPHNFSKHNSTASFPSLKGRTSFDSGDSTRNTSKQSQSPTNRQNQVALDLGAELRGQMCPSIGVDNSAIESSESPHAHDRVEDNFIPESSLFKCKRPQEMDGWDSEVPDLCKMSKQWGIPFSDLKESRELFCEYATCSAGSKRTALRDGRMSKDDFQLVLCKVSNCKTLEELPETVVQQAFQIVDHNKNGLIDFWEFAVWHNSMAFSETLILNKNERYVRQVARKLGLSAGVIDKYADLYNRFDLDANGVITYPEFKQLLHLSMKAPADLQIPEKRVEYFWHQADDNGNGTVNFEEFVSFYSRNFDAGSTDPMVSFYEGLRRTGASVEHHSW